MPRTVAQPSLTMARIDMLDAFDALLKALDSFTARFQEDEGGAWVSGCDHNQSAREQALALYRAIWYAEGQPPNETTTRAGIVIASQQTLEAAAELNEAKRSFKQVITKLRAELKRTEISHLFDELAEKRGGLGGIMEGTGLARLHLKQAYRTLPILNTAPDKIGFTWAQQGKSIRRITKAEARKLLSRSGQNTDEQLNFYQATLENMVAEDEELALVKPVSPHLRANVVRRLAVGSATRKAVYERHMVHAYLPILVPARDGDPYQMPGFRPPPTSPLPSFRFERSGRIIEPHAFLPETGLHRYQRN